MSGDAPDVYADQFQIFTNPYGAVLNFLLSSSTPSPAAAPQMERVATVRMSLEHLKLMVFTLKRQIKSHEEQSGTEVPIPAQVLNVMGIGREDWDAMWKR